MLRSKTFNVKTKGGRILKIVREHYLRDDVWCGSASCSVCTQSTFSLSPCSSLISTSGLFRYPYYLVVDTNIVLHQVREKCYVYR